MPTFGIYRVKFDGEETTAIDRGVLCDSLPVLKGHHIKVEERSSSTEIKKSAVTNRWIECEITLIEGHALHVKRRD